ncbi:MAG: RNA 2',3'-cyclic phosphodiesterase [Oscillospiraceae bacterium]
MRLFIGALLDDPVGLALRSVQDDLHARSLKGRFPDLGNLHLTLAFLGELPEAALDLVKACMDKTVSGFGAPFFLSCSHIGLFPRRGGDLYYAGFSPSPKLIRLHTRLTGALADAGVPYDPKPFLPHVTLGRNVTLQPGASAQSIPIAVPALSVSAIALMESARAQGAPVYTKRHFAYLI